MKFLKNSAVYLGSSLLNKSIPFLLLPIITRYLGPSEYGLLAIYLIGISIYEAFIGIAINTPISKYYSQYNTEELKLLIGNSYIIIFSLMIIFSVLTFAASFFIENVFSIDIFWFFLAPIISFLNMAVNIVLTLLRNQEKALKFLFIEVTRTALTFSLTLILLIKFDFGWQSQIIGLLISGIISLMISFYYLINKKLISFNFNHSTTKLILNLCLPLIPHLLGALVLKLSDRLFIEKMVSLEDVGIYSVGYTIGMVMLLYTDAFIKAWNPWFFKKITTNSRNDKISIVKYSYYFILTMFLVWAGITFLGKFFIDVLFDPKFFAAKAFVGWVALGYLIQGLYKLFFPYLVYLNKTSFLSFSTLVSAIANLILNYFLIKYFSTVGAAYATIISFTISAFMVFYYQYRRVDMPWLLK